MGVDTLVLQRLGVGGLVSFVVSVPPVAHEVDDHVVMEAGPVGHGQPHDREAALRVVGIDVHDRDVVALGQVAGIAGGPALPRLGGESHLVVCDDVEGSAGGVTGQSGEVESLGHDPFRCEGRVPVDEDGDHGVHLLHQLLPGANKLS